MSIEVRQFHLTTKDCCHTSFNVVRNQNSVGRIGKDTPDLLMVVNGLDGGRLECCNFDLVFMRRLRMVSTKLTPVRTRKLHFTNDRAFSGLQSEFLKIRWRILTVSDLLMSRRCFNRTCETISWE